MSQPNWSIEQPAVVYLRELIAANFPIVAFHWAAQFNVDPDNRHKPRVNETHRLRGVGGWNARNTEHGNVSEHSFGCAADVYVNTRNPLLKAIGDELFSRFIAAGPHVGLDQVIWNRQIWSRVHPTIQPYHGVKTHEDHVHVGFTRAGSQRRSPQLKTIVEDAKTAVDALYPP